MTRIVLTLTVGLLAGAWSIAASHAQEPTATAEPTVTAVVTGTAVPATPTSQASPAVSFTPIATPEPGELIAPAPQPTGPAVIAPRTGVGTAEADQTNLLVGAVAIVGALVAIMAMGGIAAGFVAVRTRNK